MKKKQFEKKYIFIYINQMLALFQFLVLFVKPLLCLIHNVKTSFTDLFFKDLFFQFTNYCWTFSETLMYRAKKRC